MSPMQQTEVMVRMMSESMKAVPKPAKKRTMKRELWESDESKESTDDEKEEDGMTLSVQKLLTGMDLVHEAILVEMSRLGVQTQYGLQQTTMTTSAWAERCNTLLAQNEGVRQRLMLSSRMKKGASQKPLDGQREVEKRRWLSAPG